MDVKSVSVVITPLKDTRRGKTARTEHLRMRNFLFAVVVLAVASLAAAQSGIPCPDSVNRQCPKPAGAALFLPQPQ
ncbi:hypothetical protein O3P69_005106 [Scylla paramamosain]|uniref:Uncharacterized protein n=1 Tax=Scylla paramamosain TaxID=85552 RepID=A0AAW0UC30_SCYPA